MIPPTLLKPSPSTHRLSTILARFSPNYRPIAHFSIPPAFFKLNNPNVHACRGSFGLHSPTLTQLPFPNSRLSSPSLRCYTAAQDKRVTWDDYEDIADLLFHDHRDTNPLSLRFTELHELVETAVMAHHFCEVSGECSEAALERIQMAWLDLYEQD